MSGSKTSLSSEVLEEDSATKEATEWDLELISVFVFLSRCTKMLTGSKNCSKAIHSASDTINNSVKT